MGMGTWRLCGRRGRRRGRRWCVGRTVTLEGGGGRARGEKGWGEVYRGVCDCIVLMDWRWIIWVWMDCLVERLHTYLPTCHSIPSTFIIFATQQSIRHIDHPQQQQPPPNASPPHPPPHRHPHPSPAPQRPTSHNSARRKTSSPIPSDSRSSTHDSYSSAPPHPLSSTPASPLHPISSPPPLRSRCHNPKSACDA